MGRRVRPLAGPAAGDGDRHFLPLVFDADPRAFHGVMPYRDAGGLALSRL